MAVTVVSLRAISVPLARSPMFSDRSASCEPLSATRMETLALAIRKEWLHHELDDTNKRSRRHPDGPPRTDDKIEIGRIRSHRKCREEIRRQYCCRQRQSEHCEE